jgi:hypothetical protein
VHVVPGFQDRQGLLGMDSFNDPVATFFREKVGCEHPHQGFILHDQNHSWSKITAHPALCPNMYSVRSAGALGLGGVSQSLPDEWQRPKSLYSSISRCDSAKGPQSRSRASNGLLRHSAEITWNPVRKALGAATALIRWPRLNQMGTSIPTG